MAYKITSECTGCGICEEDCPYGAIKENKESYKIDEELCDGCGNCQEICPHEAIVPKE